MRVDLVFRVYPGVGNYLTVGDRSSGLRKRPDGGVAGNLVAPNDGSWWGTLMGNVGVFGTSVDQLRPNSPLAGSAAPSYSMKEVHAQRGDAGWPANKWDPDAWISVRMDSVQQLGMNASVQPGLYATYVHESELGLATGPDESVDPDAGRLAAFYVGSEHVKILPDGQFTPGTHIEYFFRSSALLNYDGFHLMPDTTRIYPQEQFSGKNWEAIRFASWDVLPDRWKDPAWPGNSGTPGACMLVANYAYRRGDGAMWNGMSRAVGLTRPSKWGAGHGYWSSPTDAFPSDMFVAGTTVLAANRGQEGSLYDVYDVSGGDTDVPAGRLGNRLALGGCPTPTGPTAKMLRTYYRNLVVLAGDLGENLWGPFIDQTDDDAGLITDFITNPSPAVVRSVAIVGRKAGTGLAGHAATSALLTNHFGALVRTDDYRGDSQSAEDVPDLLTAGSPAITTGGIYGIFSPLYLRTDVFNLNPSVGSASVAASFENTGFGDPWPAAVYVPESPGTGRYAKTLIAAWTMGALGGPDKNRGQQGSRFSASRGGMHLLWLNLLTNMVQGCASFSQPIGIGDMPGQDGSVFTEFFDLRSANPVRNGVATVAFGISLKEQVEVSIYDVGGRRVKVLANRVFEPKPAGYTLEWDGTDDHGLRVRAGVYFYQLRARSFTGSRKLTMLRN
jgi:hypothetical protein